MYISKTQTYTRTVTSPTPSNFHFQAQPICVFLRKCFWSGPCDRCQWLWKRCSIHTKIMPAKCHCKWFLVIIFMDVTFCGLLKVAFLWVLEFYEFRHMCTSSKIACKFFVISIYSLAKPHMKSMKISVPRKIVISQFK